MSDLICPELHPDHYVNKRCELDYAHAGMHKAGVLRWISHISFEDHMKQVEEEHGPFDDEVDMVNHPPHYRGHPSGVECIQITEHMGFCLSNAMKYIWRADLKNDAIEDLEKAAFYLDREIKLRKKQLAGS